MKNVIRVTILTALAVTAGLSTALAQDQPPPDCYPCVVTPIVIDQAPAALNVSSALHFSAVANTVAADSVSATLIDQPPPDCYPCVTSASFIDQPPPDCYPCVTSASFIDQPPPDCYPCIVD